VKKAVVFGGVENLRNGSFIFDKRGASGDRRTDRRYFPSFIVRDYDLLCLICCIFAIRLLEH